MPVFSRDWLHFRGGKVEYYINEYEKLAMKNKEWQIFYRYSRNKRLVVWGANSSFFSRLAEMIFFDPDTDCAVDNDASLHNEIRFGLKVNPPSLLKDNDDNFYILVLSGLYYDDIKFQLESYGLCDKKDFIDARLLIGDMKF